MRALAPGSKTSCKSSSSTGACGCCGSACFTGSISGDCEGTKAGDCDDYSTLASSELSARGYQTHLVSVRLKNVVHVVCYITEANGYLDYNLRAKGSGIVHCGPSLAEIADAVAKSFDSTWSSVSEFTYRDGVKRLVSTAVAQPQ